MARPYVKTKYGKGGYGTRLQRASQLVKQARATVINARRFAPARTGGFYGLYTKRGRTELKTIDQSGQNSTITAAGTVTLLNGIGQGTDYTQRIGRQVLLKAINFKIDIRLAGLTTGAGETVRCLLVYDCQTNAAAPAVTDILNTATPLSPMNLNNRDRFKVLKDWIVPLEVSQYTAGVLNAGSPMRHVKKTYKRISMDMIFGATGSTVGSINTGGIFLLMIGIVGSVAVFDYDSRVRFMDA